VLSNSLGESNLPASTKSSEVSKDTNSPETSPSIETSERKKVSGGLQENEKRHSSPEEGLSVFSTEDNPVLGSDAIPLCETAETRGLSESTSKGSKQLSDGGQSDLRALAGPMAIASVTNDTFELDETKQTERDVQVGLFTL
jgi:hypothetical protein